MTESQFEREEDWAFWATEESERIAADMLETKDLSGLVFEHDEGALLGILLDALRYKQDRAAVDAAYDDLIKGLRSTLEADAYFRLEEQRKAYQKQRDQGDDYWEAA